MTLAPGESKTVTFVLSSDNLAFWTKDKKYQAEAGKFNVWIARNVEEGLMGTFELVNSNSIGYE